MPSAPIRSLIQDDPAPEGRTDLVGNTTRLCVERARLSYLLDDLLDDELVVVARVSRVHLDVVVRPGRIKVRRQTQSKIDGILLLARSGP